MSSTRTQIPSPARSLPLTPRRKETPRKARSVCSPARSNASGRLTCIIREHREQSIGSFVLSPMPRKSVLTDNTDIEEPGRKSWWRDLGDNSRDVMEVLQENNVVEPHNIFDNIEVLSQEDKRQHTLDLHDSSDSDSIHSIVIPQKKLFHAKENQPQKRFNQFGTRETLEKLQKTNATSGDKTVSTARKELFQKEPSSRPVFPAALLDISANTTVSEKTMTAVLETKGRAHNLFGNQQQQKKTIHSTKRKNMFAKFIASDSEDELPDIQPKFFALQKKSDSRRPSLASRGLDASMASSIDIELEDWQLLPSSTMVDHQLNTTLTAGQRPKRSRLSKLSEAETGTNSSGSPKSKQSEKSFSGKNKSKIHEKSPQQNTPLRTRNSSKISLEADNQINKSRNKSLKLNTSQSSIVTKGKNKSDIMNKSHNASINKSLNKSKNTSKSKASDNVDGGVTVPKSPVVVNEIQDTDNKGLEDKPEEPGNYEDDDLHISLTLEEDSADEVDDVNVPKDKSVANQSSKEINSSKNTSQKPAKENNVTTTEVIAHSANAKESTETSQPNSIKSTQNDTEKVKNNKDLGEIDQPKNFDNASLNRSQNLLVESEYTENRESGKQNHEIEQTENENEQDEIENYHEKIVNDQNESKIIQSVSHKAQEESEKTQFETESDHMPSQELENDDEKDEPIENKIQNPVEEKQNKSELENNEGQEVHDEQEEIENEDEEEQIESEVNNEIQEEIEDGQEASQEEIEDEQEVSQEEIEDEQEVSQEEIQNDDENEEEKANQSEVENDESKEEVEEEQEVSQEEIQNEEEEAENESEYENNQSQEEIENEKDVSQEKVQTDNEEEQDNESEAENNEEEQENESEAENNESQEEVENEQDASQEEIEQNESDVDEQMECDEANESLEVAANSDQDDNHENDSDHDDLQENDSDQHDAMESEDGNQSNEATVNSDHSDNPDNDQDNDDHIENTETPNVSHDTTGRNRKKKSITPEAILRNSRNDINLTTVHGRNTSIRKTKSMLHPNMRLSLEPARESMEFTDGSKNSSAEGSGWDSHRTTRKTLRQTFGKDFTPRKSLRALVMEKSAKRRATAVDDSVAKPQANSTELVGPDFSSNDYEMCDDPTPPVEVSIRTRQATLVEYLERAKVDRAEERAKVEEAVRRRLENNTRTEHVFKVPARPVPRPKPKPKKPLPSLIPLEDLPEEFIEDLKYKPPKRFAPRNASWLTKRLYKYLETKLEPKYDYKARVRAEKFAQMLYDFVQGLRRRGAPAVASPAAVAVLKTEMARLNIVNTHYDFYNFFHEFMPREVRVKVIPDIVNKIPHPRSGVFSDIL